ncbi:MAG TPA: thioredoxin domain-containing protein [Deltaproteobacteria bacterium]|nr:thioredoxin domain-containing protein [Deltaproteobacteria bacterium]
MERHNRLKEEISPYLLQHAANPVAWRPWNEEAFTEAQDLDKAVFLSIGYSSCHWCHVMARECFEDDEVARLMNDAFICVKVDREELPHIDATYMTACQMMTGNAGWPLTIIMTPDKQPFFAATYLPKHSRQGLIGLMELIPIIDNTWKTNQKDLIHSARRISAAVADALKSEPGSIPDKSLVQHGFEGLAAGFSPTYGGFGDAPKFPAPHNIMFLLRYHRRFRDSRALNMATRSLDAMRMGGIFDHVGFGFHRYSTDAKWLVPHFEKMLYDQALAAIAYTEAYLATGRGSYQRTAREILTYVLREMVSAEGLFFSSQDADTEGSEGKFYVWTDQELRSILNKEDYLFATKAYSLQKQGNLSTAFAHDKIILHMNTPPERTAEHLGMDDTTLSKRLEQIRAALFEKRSMRARPFTDESTLTDINGLMIAALARAGQTFSSREYLEAAAKAADCILENIKDSKGRLLHVYRPGRPGAEASAKDYAFLIWGLIELYEAVFDLKYLNCASALARECIEYYWDNKDGGIFLTSCESDVVIARIKDSHDGALPSSNSVFLLDLILLARITGDTDLEQKAYDTAKAFSKTMATSPSSHIFMLMGLDLLLGPACEVVLSSSTDTGGIEEKLLALRSRFLPHVVVVHRPDEATKGLPEHIKDKSPQDNKTTAYVCSNRSCLAPTTDTAEMIRLVMKKGRATQELE